MKFDRGEMPECLAYINKYGNQNYKKWNKKWIKSFKRNPSARFSWHQYKNQAVDQLIKHDLRIMSHYHCAFCDKHMLAADSDTIEHFYPKKLYPEQAFTWSNLFLACSGCQKIPLGWKKLEETHRSLILKPDEVGYTFDTYFLYDTRNGDILVNKFNTTEETQKRASATITYYQLNAFRRPYKRREMFKRYFSYKTPNHLKASLNCTINEVPYRFIYL